LYEDEGDNYDYEHGVYSTIPVHWDDKAGTLTIGDRHGSFPGMLEHRSFRIVSVMNGRGTGISPSAEADATVEYDGKTTSVHLRGRP
jgi:alpha-D-xyloside xylohydrolase